MARHDNQRGNAREDQIVDRDAEIPRRVAQTATESLIDNPPREKNRGGGELRIEDTPGEDGKLPPPSAHRADTMVRAVSPDARQEMEANGLFTNQASFTKGINAPTVDQSRGNYTVEEMDEMLREAPRPLFPDTPGGDGATPLSADRTSFLRTMADRGHFPSEQETEKWARAVFNAIRQRAIEKDDALASEFAQVVRIGEAPEVQVEEMMWGGDFVDRISRALSVAGSESRQEFYRQVAEEAGETLDDPWVDAAVYSFFGALKAHGNDATPPANLGELHEIWERA